MNRTSPYRLYRNPQRGRIAGVCAGLAEYFGVGTGVVRFGWFLGLVFFTAPVLLAYIALALLLPPRPRELFASPEEEEMRRAVHLGPRRTLSDVRVTFAEVDKRLAGLEAAVLSKEFDLRRKFNELR